MGGLAVGCARKKEEIIPMSECSTTEMMESTAADDAGLPGMWLPNRLSGGGEVASKEDGNVGRSATSSETSEAKGRDESTRLQR